MNETGFQLINIILLESHFERKPIIDFNNLEGNVSLKIGHNQEANKLIVMLETDFEQKNKNTNEIEVKAIIKMISEFQFEGVTSVSVTDFANVNAPAIIFPFVREHLANLSMRAGMPTIWLQPINFVRLSEESKNK
ncbi:MAG: protein-export chaperone SecB [Raineya sp.]|nr:protein-export chaperone SecB [Raineya sp.]MDW8296880.1 protein-export chaperone SecB [Raineya sp.]